MAMKAPCSRWRGLHPAQGLQLLPSAADQAANLRSAEQPRQLDREGADAAGCGFDDDSLSCAETPRMAKNERSGQPLHEK